MSKIRHGRLVSGTAGSGTATQVSRFHTRKSKNSIYSLNHSSVNSHPKFSLKIHHVSATQKVLRSLGLGDLVCLGNSKVSSCGNCKKEEEERKKNENNMHNYSIIGDLLEQQSNEQLFFKNKGCVEWHSESKPHCVATAISNAEVTA